MAKYMKTEDGYVERTHYDARKEERIVFFSQYIVRNSANTTYSYDHDIPMGVEVDIYIDDELEHTVTTYGNNDGIVYLSFTPDMSISLYKDQQEMIIYNAQYTGLCKLVAHVIVGELKPLDPKYLPTNMPISQNVQEALDIKMDKENPVGTGSFSINRKEGTAIGDYSVAIGYNTVAPTDYLTIYGKYNDCAFYSLEGVEKSNYPINTQNNKVYMSNSITIDEYTGKITMNNPYTQLFTAQTTQMGRYLSSYSKGYGNLDSIIYMVRLTQVNPGLAYLDVIEYTATGKYAHIVGNGTSDTARSNAHTLDWDGNAWYQGDVYVGGTSQDDGEKLLKESDGLLIADMGLSIKQIPIATPNSVCNIAYGNGRFIALPHDDTSDVFYSDDFMTWKKSTMPFSSAWCSITYGNGIFVAGAESTTKTAWSSDGINWNSTGTTTYDKDYYYIAYGNGVFVAVDPTDYGGIYYGAGKIWHEATSVLSTKNWGAITFGNDKFVMIEVQPGFSYSRKVAYSNDGRIWTEKTLPNEAQWCSIAYGKEQYIAVARGSNQIAYSADGDTWNIAQLPVVVESPTIVWGNDKFIIADSNVILYSTDGTTWDSAPLSSSYLWYSITHSEDKFVAYAAIDGIKRMIHSADGITWSYTYETIAQNNEDKTDDIKKLLLDGYVTQEYVDDALANIDVITSWNDVEDKPFGEESGLVEILPETALDFEFVSIGTIGGRPVGDYEIEIDIPELVDGKEYIVIWNGVEHRTIAHEQSLGYYFGNLSLSYWGGDDTGEPFGLTQEVTSDGHSSVMFATSEGPYTVSILTQGTVVKQIDEKFIPDNIARISTATVGQTIAVKAVDENGKPTEWEAVKMADPEWKVIKTLTLTEDAETVVIDKDDNGNSFSLRECIMYIEAKATEASKISYIPNGYWVSDTYTTSAQTTATDYRYKFAIHCFGKTNEYFWGYELFSKGQPSGANYRMKTDNGGRIRAPITSFKVVSKFAAGAEFVLYGKESNE